MDYSANTYYFDTYFAATQTSYPNSGSYSWSSGYILSANGYGYWPLSSGTINSSPSYYYPYYYTPYLYVGGDDSIFPLIFDK